LEISIAPTLLIECLSNTDRCDFIHLCHFLKY